VVGFSVYNRCEALARVGFSVHKGGEALAVVRFLVFDRLRQVQEFLITSITT
jgi:hypothetical protein